MTDKNRVVVVEDDPYTRDQLLNLLSRDWRTRVVGEFDSFSKKAFQDFVCDENNNYNAVILDTEVPWNPNWPIEAFEIIRALEKPPKLIFLCTLPLARYWNDILLDYDFYGGYLAKQEILYSIPAAVAMTTQGYIVSTESVQNLRSPFHTRKNMVVVDGTKAFHGFTHREQEVLRLGILFSLSHRDIEDELVISRDWISEVLGSIYDKLSIKDILSGEIPLESIFTDEAVLLRAQQILEKYQAQSSGKNLRKTPWLSTLAFHILTTPEIRAI